MCVFIYCHFILLRVIYLPAAENEARGKEKKSTSELREAFYERARNDPAVIARLREMRKTSNDSSNRKARGDGSVTYRYSTFRWLHVNFYFNLICDAYSIVGNTEIYVVTSTPGSASCIAGAFAGHGCFSYRTALRQTAHRSPPTSHRPLQLTPKACPHMCVRRPG